MPTNEIIRYFPVPEKKPPFYFLMTGISHFEKTYYIKRHNSTFYNCEIIISGEGEVTCGGKTHRVGAGDVYVLPPGMPHVYRSSAKNPWIKMFFCAGGSLAEALFREYDLTSVRIMHAPGLYDIFRDFFNLTFNKKLSLQETNSRGALLFHRFAQELAKAKPQENITEGQRLREFIEQNVQNNITLEDMAAHIYRSPSQTIRLFRKEYGITPYEYYMEKRIEIARTI